MSKVYYSDTFDHDQYLEDLLQSKSLQGNERVKRFIELHESYMKQGNVKRAAHLLTKDHYLSTFPSIRCINGTDFVKTTNLSVVYHEHQNYSSAVWLLDSECMSVSLENYKTCSELAGFYKNLDSSDAKELGGVLNHMLSHFQKRRHFSMKIWWRNNPIHYDKSLPQVRSMLIFLFGLSVCGLILSCSLFTLWYKSFPEVRSIISISMLGSLVCVIIYLCCLLCFAIILLYDQ